MNIRTIVINAAAIIAGVSFLTGFVAALMAFSGRLDHETFKLVFNLISLTWFLSAPLCFTPQLFGQAFTEAAARAWFRSRSKNGQ